MIIILTTPLKTEVFDFKKQEIISHFNTGKIKTKKEFHEQVLECFKLNRSNECKIKIINPSGKLSVIFNSINEDLEKERIKLDINFSALKIDKLLLDEDFNYLPDEKTKSFHLAGLNQIEEKLEFLINNSSLRSIYWTKNVSA